MAQLKSTTVNGTLTLNGENIGNTLSDLSSTVEGLKTTYTNELTNLNTKVNNINFKVAKEAPGSIITLDSITFDRTTLTNVEFENVGNGIFLSKYILKRQSMDNLLKIGGTIKTNKGVGECDIGQAAATSIEASLRRQFGDSVSLKTYTREYDGATHNEKVFLPLECEVHGYTQYSKDTSTLRKYPQWDMSSKIKSEINNTSNNWYWWNANKSSSYGNFCLVDDIGDPNYDVSYIGSFGVALAFYL